VSVQNPGGVPNKPPFEMGVANFNSIALRRTPALLGFQTEKSSCFLMAFRLDIFLIIRYNKHILQKC
jgi:hypothetical protein